MLPSIVLQFILDVLWFSVLSFDAHRYDLPVKDSGLTTMRVVLPLMSQIALVRA